MLLRLRQHLLSVAQQVGAMLVTICPSIVMLVTGHVWHTSCNGHLGGNDPETENGKLQATVGRKTNGASEAGWVTEEDDR
jgi:hypothetical protein